MDDFPATVTTHAGSIRSVAPLSSGPASRRTTSCYGVLQAPTFSKCS
jgi:hypothetical protein